MTEVQMLVIMVGALVGVALMIVTCVKGDW